MTGTPIARVKGVSHRYGATGALGAPRTKRNLKAIVYLIAGDVLANSPI